MSGTTKDENTMQMMGLLPVVFEAPTLYEDSESVIVPVEVARGKKRETVQEEVTLDPQYGPRLLLPDGSTSFMPRMRFNDAGTNCGSWHHTMDTYRKGWRSMTATEQTVCLHTVARRNRALKERIGLA
mmetsp:Transcript_50496/g.156250  ORF Transcript_50496/g.156250 Transcript_50496/m.156250 type:complete len:128 (-) Transcript_50496:37-420(-)